MIKISNIKPTSNLQSQDQKHHSIKIAQLSSLLQVLAHLVPKCTSASESTPQVANLIIVEMR